MNRTTKMTVRENLKAQYNMALTEEARRCAHTYVVITLTMKKTEREEIENFFSLV